MDEAKLIADAIYRIGMVVALCGAGIILAILQLRGRR